MAEKMPQQDGITVVSHNLFKESRSRVGQIASAFLLFVGGRNV